MKIHIFPTVFLKHLYESMDLIIADMFEFICKDYYDSYYYLSSILLSPMLRLSHLWPVGVLFVRQHWFLFMRNGLQRSGYGCSLLSALSVSSG